MHEIKLIYISGAVYDGIFCRSMISSISLKFNRNTNVLQIKKATHMLKSTFLLLKAKLYTLNPKYNNYRAYPHEFSGRVG